MIMAKITFLSIHMLFCFISGFVIQKSIVASKTNCSPGWGGYAGVHTRLSSWVRGDLKDASICASLSRSAREASTVLFRVGVDGEKLKRPMTRNAKDDQSQAGAYVLLSHRSFGANAVRGVPTV